MFNPSGAPYPVGLIIFETLEVSQENVMSGLLRGRRLALISCLVLSAPPTLAQASPAWVEPPSGSDDPAVPGPAAPIRSAQRPLPTASVSREQAARDLAYAYLNLWSAPNRVSLASASSFYGPTVTFHGHTRTIGSVLAEKRRFAERWPDRTYRHRPETTQVACEADGARCTVRSSFDFAARNRRNGHRSLGGHLTNCCWLLGAFVVRC